jgi:uncharacterized Zn-binding protein involved in type VI secretion
MSDEPRKIPAHEGPLVFQRPYGPPAGQPAAREGDDNAHGGKIESGDNETLMAGKPAAREGDVISCPKHGDGRIGKVSATVFIGGAAAARQTDKCGCPEGGKSAEGRPGTCGPGTKTTVYYTGLSLGDEENNEVWGQVQKVENVNADGVVDGTQYQVSNARFSGSTGTGGDYSVDVEGASATGQALPTSEGGSIQGGIDGHIAQGEANYQGDGYSVGGKANFLDANASGTLLVGNDGVRSGFLIGGDASANIASVEGTVSADTTLGDDLISLTDGVEVQNEFEGALLDVYRSSANLLNVGVSVTGGGGAGISAGAQAGLYADNTDSKVHGVLKGKLIADAKIEIKIGSSKYHMFTVTKPPAKSNNEIVSADENIFVGP